MTDTYLIDENGEPVPEPDLAKWAHGMTPQMRRIAWDDLPGGASVSTCFLGVDHLFGEPGPPLLYETMIFNSPEDEDYQRRYTTKADALRGHAEAIRKVELRQGKNNSRSQTAQGKRHIRQGGNIPEKNLDNTIR